MPKITIMRKKSRVGCVEEPELTGAGHYKLGDPRFSGQKHHAWAQVVVPTIEEAAALIRDRGFHIWMGAKGKRASLICPSSIVIKELP